MPFDGILTNSIAEELNQRLLGGRIGRIHQITGDALVLQIRAAGENHRLLLSCNPSSARIHLTERQYENPSTLHYSVCSLENTFQEELLGFYY